MPSTPEVAVAGPGVNTLVTLEPDAGEERSVGPLDCQERGGEHACEARRRAHDALERARTPAERERARRQHRPHHTEAEPHEGPGIAVAARAREERAAGAEV